MTERNRPHLVIGTAGHIDHGKTSLVKALTGTDLDRLADEKRRGITIELGFAFYGDRAAFVDVPGHERLVKTMVAGASAMRAALLVVAGDDGVMPQTREHLAVLDALGVHRAVVAVTKADLVDDEELLELVAEEVRDLLEPTAMEGSPVVIVDSVSGRGIDTLRGELDRMIDETVPEEDPGYFRMPVDRSFLIKGHGRVVTGTVWSGEAREGDRLMLRPGDIPVRVRGLQAHEEPVESVRRGDRAALNLATDTEPVRGEMLFSPERGVETEFLDVSLKLLPDARTVEHRTRVRLHLGTGEAIGRVLLVGAEAVPGGSSGIARIALESPLPAMHADRGVIRLYSPMETLGGVVVLDPMPPDRRRTVRGLATRLHALSSDPATRIREFIASRHVMRSDDLLRLVPWTKEAVRDHLSRLEDEEAAVRIGEGGDWLVAAGLWNDWRSCSGEVLADYHKHHPDEPGMPKKAWQERVTAPLEVPAEVVDALVAQLIAGGEATLAEGRVAHPQHRSTLRREDEADAAAVLGALRGEGVNVPAPGDVAERLGLKESRVRDLIRALKQVGDVVILDEKTVLPVETLAELKRQLAEAFPEGAPFALGDAARALGTTRKYAVPLMEHLDKEGFTEREADTRRVRDRG